MKRKSPTYKCNICDANFASKQSLNLYVESVHDEIKPFNCNKCDSSFAQKQHLKMHIQSVHENKKSYNVFFLHELIQLVSSNLVLK